MVVAVGKRSNQLSNRVSRSIDLLLGSSDRKELTLNEFESDSVASSQRLELEKSVAISLLRSAVVVERCSDPTTIEVDEFEVSNPSKRVV